MSEPIHRLSAVDLAGLVRSGSLKATEVVAVFLTRIQRHNERLNAFVHVDEASALAQAEGIDRIVAAGRDPGPLAGVPLGVKDLEDVAGMPTRAGSLLTGSGPAVSDSTQVARLRAAGAIPIGKTATPEFGSLIYTWSRLSGSTHNPWHPQATPGGSSGGSAAAVAAGLVPLATASDGGGSIRIPAAYCGLVGLKPTNGLVSRGPRRHAAANLSSYGPLAASVRDVARALDQVAGDHPGDPFSFPRPCPSYEASLSGLPDGLRWAWSDTLGFGRAEEEAGRIARAAALRLAAALGAEEVEATVRMPDAGEDWIHLWAMNTYTELAHLPSGKRKLLSPVVVEALDVATRAGPEDFRAAIRRRYQVLGKLNEVFERVDFLVTPTTAFRAFEPGGPMPRVLEGVDLPVRHRHIDPSQGACFTYPFNLTGQPAISLPAGTDSRGVPLGVQVAAPRFADARLLAMASAYESLEGWARLAPGYWD